MKKYFSVILICLMMLLCFYGCANSESTVEGSVAVEDDVQTLSSIADSTSGKETEKDEVPEQILIETEVVEEANPYAEILDMFYTNLSDNWIALDGENREDVYDPDSVSQHLKAPGLSLDDVGYELRDLDEDGTEELIISNMKAASGCFIELYTVCNNQVVHIISNDGLLSDYYLALDNSINRYGSQGVVSSLNVNYRLDAAAGALAINQAVLCRHADDQWLYTEEEFLDKQSYAFKFETMKSITESEANALLEQFPENISLSLTPFSEYESIALDKPETADSDGALYEQYCQILADHTQMRSDGCFYSGEYAAGGRYDLAYTLYDIDKDGASELIVRENVHTYYIYTCGEEAASLCATEFWNYSDCLFTFDGNGMLVHDGGMGSLRLEYVWLYSMTEAGMELTDTVVSSEYVGLDGVRSYIENLKPINNFCDVADMSLLQVAA